MAVARLSCELRHFREGCILLKGHAITFGRLHTWTLTFYYVKETDVLVIRSPWHEEGTWVDLPDEVRIKVDPQTGEAVEFQIKTFRRRFLAKRPDLLPLWGQIKPTPIALRRMENTPFIAVFLGHMERLTYDRTQQLDPASL